jgi:hypothetical protein
MSKVRDIFNGHASTHIFTYVHEVCDPEHVALMEAVIEHAINARGESNGYPSLSIAALRLLYHLTDALEDYHREHGLA